MQKARYAKNNLHRQNGVVTNKKGLRATKHAETKVANMSAKRSTHIVIKTKAL